MRARFLARAAVAWLFLGCIPSEDLASYSSGSGSREGDDGIEGAAAPDGEGGAAPISTSGDAGETGASEADNLPDMLQGNGGSAQDDSDPSGPSVGPQPDPPVVDPNDPDAPGDATPARQFRFVRLIADSDLAAGPLTSMAEFNLVDAEGALLPRAGWVVTADSEEEVFVGGAQAEFAIDGDPNTMWHTAWFELEPPPHPHVFDVDLGQPHTIGGFRYLPRQDDALDGRVSDYRFFVSADGVDWGEPVVAGELPSDTAVEQTVRFTP